MLHELFCGIEVTVHEYITEGSRVLSRWTGHGTHEESGRSVTGDGATITHVEGGKMVDDWEYWDRLELAEQLASRWLERQMVGLVARRTMKENPNPVTAPRHRQLRKFVRR